MNDAPQKPWHRRPILPPWLLGWLFAATLCGFVFAIAFGLLLTPWSLVRFMVAFGIGLGMSLLILTFAHAKSNPADRLTMLVPPLAVRFPIFIAFAVGIAAIWIDDAKITTGAAHGNRVIIQGATVVAVSIVIMAGAGAACVVLMRAQPRSFANMLGASAGLLIAAAGLVFAGIRIVERWL